MKVTPPSFPTSSFGMPMCQTLVRLLLDRSPISKQKAILGIASFLAAVQLLMITPAYGQSEHFALVVTGASGSEEFHEKFQKWSIQLLDALQLDLGFPKDHVYSLSEVRSQKPEETKQNATKLHLTKMLEEIRSRLHAGDLFLIILLGHASFDGQDYKFNLVGPDFTGQELASWLLTFREQILAVVAATPCSGILARQISLSNRMLITATKSEFENNNIIFPEFFIEALRGRKADRDKNSRLSLLEVYLYASHKTAAWYQEQGLLATEHPTLEDWGSPSAISDEFLAEGNADKLRVARCYLDGPKSTPPSGQPGREAAPALMALDQQKSQLEESIRQLQQKKSALSEEDYTQQLEALLIELAQINQKIKDAKKDK